MKYKIPYYISLIVLIFGGVTTVGGAVFGFINGMNFYLMIIGFPLWFGVFAAPYAIVNYIRKEKETKHEIH